MTNPSAVDPLRDAAREAVDDMSSAIDMIRWAASTLAHAEVFCGHGHADVVDEALHLTIQRLGLPVEVPESLLYGRLRRAERQAIADLVVARAEQRTPLAYLTGSARFAGLEFAVTRDVLVPRSPIAELIESQFEPWFEPDAVTRILEIGTGSGCIALACAAHFPHADVVATDISPAALVVAERNRASHGLEQQVTLLQSDVFAHVDGTFDLIISNPPYVTEADFAAAPAEFHQEPALGLVAGADGLDIVRRILADAATFLRDDGILVVEVGASRVYLQQAFPDLPFSWPEFERGGDGVFILERDALPL